MSVLDKLKTSPLWLVAPSLLVAGAVGGVVAGYEPLVFDPSLYATPAADASELKTVDAEELEAENASKSKASKAATTTTSSAPSTDGLEDGTWTGYAACGEGNEYGWKPYYVAVKINVAGGEVTGITDIAGASNARSGMKALSWDAAENQDYLDRAIEGHGSDEGVESQIDNELAAGNSPDGVDAVSGATYSSVAIYNAYVDAVGQASSSSGGSGSGASASAASAQKVSVPKKKKKSTKVKSKAKVGALADGTWRAYAKCGPDPDQDWKPYYIGVSVTVKGGKVVKVSKIEPSSTGEKGAKKLTWDAAENEQYLDGAVSGVGSQLKTAAAAGKSLGSIDTVSGATYSSKAIFNAYYAALEKAAKAAGSKVKTDDSGKKAASEEAADDQPAAQEDENLDEFYGYAYCSSSGGDSWDPYYIFVKVGASEGAVKKVLDAYGDADGLVDPLVRYSASQNATYLNWAIEGKFGGTGYRMKSVVTQIQAKIDAGLEAQGIQTVSGATRSSNSIIAAYQAAAANAAAGTGATPEEAVAGTTAVAPADEAG